MVGVDDDADESRVAGQEGGGRVVEGEAFGDEAW